MNVIHKLRVGLVAAAFLAALTSAASASALVWKVNGFEAKSKVAVQWSSTVYFRETEAGVQSEFACELIHKGTVGPGNLGEITSITNKAGKTPIACSMVQTGAQCKSGAEIEPEGLPWATELLGGGGSGWDGRNAQWRVKCVTAGGKMSERCEGWETPKAENIGGEFGEVQLNLYSQFKALGKGGHLECETFPLYPEGYEDMKTITGETLSVG